MTQRNDRPHDIHDRDPNTRTQPSAPAEGRARLGKRRRKEKTDWVDDGRVIVDMSVEGMPDSLGDKMIGGKRTKMPRLDSQGQPIPPPEPIELTRAEEREIRRGVVRATLLVGGAVLVLFVLLMLFLVFVWLR